MVKYELLKQEHFKTTYIISWNVTTAISFMLLLIYLETQNI